MILDEFVEVRLSGATARYYESLGYDIPMKEASRRTKRRTGANTVPDLSQSIVIKVTDLPRQSKQKVHCKCDVPGCNNETFISFANYMDVVIKNNGIYYCRQCGYKKEGMMRKEWSDEKKKQYRDKVNATMLERYGEDLFKNEIIANKKKMTNLLRRGVEFPMQSSEVQKKSQETSLKHFGVRFPTQSEIIKQKTIQTNLERFGVSYSMQSESVQAKSRQTNLERYGVEYPMQSKEIQAKSSQSFYSSGSMKSSKQQNAIYNIYSKSQNCELNYPILHSSGDIVFLDDMIDFEVDYNGHWNRVEFGVMTESEFEQHEVRREKSIKSQGYKVVRLISRNSRLIPSESKLLEILSLTREYFAQYPNHTWINWNMDDSKRYDTEHKDGIPFDFGELQKANNLETKALS